MKGLGLGFLKGLRFWRVRVTGRVRVFGRDMVSISFCTSAIMKLPKYGKTCVVLEGTLCY